ncbi:MAG: ArsR/SmtB family transcription factor [Deltaproteobacteria bacterium]
MKLLTSKECARVFKALAEETRLEIMQCLFKEERSVSDIAKEIGKEVSKVSHHLGILRGAGLVTDKKEGKFVVYQIHPVIYNQIKRNNLKNALIFNCCSIEFDGKSVSRGAGGGV